MTSKLRFLREMRGFSQDYVSQKLGIAQNTYSRWEIEEKKIPKEMLAKISDLLGISTEDIESPHPLVINIQHANGNGNDSGSQPSLPSQQTPTWDIVEKLLAAKDNEIATLKEYIVCLKSQIPSFK